MDKIKMDTIKKKYIINEQNKKVAVQIPIKTYEQIEEILENYALVQLINENRDTEKLNLNEAKEYYSNLEKE